MRVIRLLMLGALLVLAGLCFDLAWGGAQDTDAVLDRSQAEQPDFTLRAPSTRVVVVAEPTREEPEAPRWEEWVLSEPEPKVLPQRRRFKRAVAKVAPDTGLIAPEDAIRMVLRRKRPAFERCYEQALKQQASFDGFVVVAMSITADGRVTDVHVEEGTRRDAQVGACIAAQLRQLQLPPLTEEADLLIPIRLQAKRPT